MDGSVLPSIAAAIDFERYPIAPLAGARAQALAGGCRAQLAATGSCLLPGFLTAEAVATMAAEAVAIAPLAHRKPGGRGSTASVREEACTRYPTPATSITQRPSSRASTRPVNWAIISVSSWMRIGSIVERR